MKFAVLFSILISPLAFAEGETTATTEETVSLSQEATAPLFERVRGAHTRALQTGKVVAMAKPESK